MIRCFMDYKKAPSLFKRDPPEIIPNFIIHFPSIARTFIRVALVSIIINQQHGHSRESCGIHLNDRTTLAFQWFCALSCVLFMKLSNLTVKVFPRNCYRHN